MQIAIEACRATGNAASMRRNYAWSGVFTMVQYCLWMLAVWLPVQAWAQSLGAELILSRLGDPVEVEIALNDWQHVELDKIQVSNATPEQYKAFKIDYLPLLASLNFNLVGPDRSGAARILVSSRKPVAEPYLDLLVVLKWPGGSTLREYVLLFDPPLPDFTAAGKTTSQQGSPVTKQTADTDGRNDNRLPKTTAPDVRTQAAIEVEKVAPGVGPVPDDGRRQYQVRPGDSLWNIARQFQPAGIGENLYQFLISLHDLNRSAFINGNISLLKAEAMLHIPTARDIAAINPGSAQTVFDQLWRAGVSSPDVADSGPDAPVFKPLNDQPLPPQPAAKTTEHTPPTGIERAGKLLDDSGPLLPAPTPVLAPVANQQPASDAAEVKRNETVPVIALVPQQTSGSQSRQAQVEVNPFLQKITASATTIRDLLEQRQQRLQALEQQILAVQTEMQLAQSHAAELDQKLKMNREQRQAVVTNKAILLGLLAAALLLALSFTIHLSLKWNRDYQLRLRIRKLP